MTSNTFSIQSENKQPYCSENIHSNHNRRFLTSTRSRGGPGKKTRPPYCDQNFHTVPDSRTQSGKLNVWIIFSHLPFRSCQELWRSSDLILQLIQNQGPDLDPEVQLWINTFNNTNNSRQEQSTNTRQYTVQYYNK